MSARPKVAVVVGKVLYEQQTPSGWAYGDRRGSELNRQLFHRSEDNIPGWIGYLFFGLACHDVLEPIRM